MQIVGRKPTGEMLRTVTNGHAKGTLLHDISNPGPIRYRRRGGAREALVLNGPLPVRGCIDNHPASPGKDAASWRGVCSQSLV